MSKIERYIILYVLRSIFFGFFFVVELREQYGRIKGYFEADLLFVRFKCEREDEYDFGRRLVLGTRHPQLVFLFKAGKEKEKKSHSWKIVVRERRGSRL